MEGFKSLPFCALALAMLASSALSIPAVGPPYRYLPMSVEVQQFPDELLRQNDMANEPDASLQRAQQVLPPQQRQALPEIIEPPEAIGNLSYCIYLRDTCMYTE